ncbi:hypothetical protein H0H87_009809 [Tephrocybe sp. NHM501043]|nr:hypothetical protein H0H87_009809 [Tephrocybe sp. NHM501043]
MASDDDAYSELTDLSDDDAYNQSSKNRKGVDNLSGHYRIRNVLKVPRATTYTAQALYDQIHGDDIKLDPEYQRDVVWPDTKMIGLIDSVFRNFYMPPIIFSVVTYDDGSEKRICIDGKQRLTSIQRFMDGLIPHKDHLTNQKLWYTDNGGESRQKKKLLPEKYRKLFANKQIVCIEYTDVSDHDEREIFQRVQLGMALTPAEKLQVTNTPRSAFIRSLLSHFLSTTTSPSSSPEGAGSLAHFDWDRTRGADYRCIAQIVFSMFYYPAFPSTTEFVSTKSALKGLGAITQVEKFLSDPVPFPSEFEANVHAALRVVGAIASDRQMFGNGKEKMEVRTVFRVPTKIAPVEIVLVGLLVGVHMAAAKVTGVVPPKMESKLEKDEREAREAAGRKKLAEGIYLMRKDVRDLHVDIRMNTRVSKSMVDFVREWSPAASSPIPASQSVISSTTGKRKRSVESGEVVSPLKAENHDEEEGELRPRKIQLKFKKTPIPLPTASPITPASLPPKPLPTPLPASAGPKRDRMAVLRAAKLQTQSSNSNTGSPSATPPLHSPTHWGNVHGPPPSKGVLVLQQSPADLRG